jgi:uncharacterized protein YdhG (YjbR/CyaY superfamily)
MNNKTPKNISDYIDRFPKEVQQLLQKIGVAIKKAAPEATETISYGIPAFALDEKLVWFARVQEPYWVLSGRFRLLW